MVLPYLFAVTPNEAWRKARTGALKAFANPNKPEGKGLLGLRNRRHRKAVNRNRARKRRQSLDSPSHSIGGAGDVGGQGKIMLVDGVGVKMRGKPDQVRCQHAMDAAVAAVQDIGDGGVDYGEMCETLYANLAGLIEDGEFDNLDLTNALALAEPPTIKLEDFMASTDDSTTHSTHPRLTSITEGVAQLVYEPSKTNREVYEYNATTMTWESTASYALTI